MGIAFALFAGLFNSLTNYSVKRGVDVQGNAKPFFLCQILASTVFAVIFGPILKRDFSISLYPSVLGICAGVLLYIMLFSLGRAVEKGSPGMTFAVLNSATILPGIIMAGIFGVEKGFAVSMHNITGFIIVIIGLFWGMGGLKDVQERKSWLLFASLVFSFHVLLLCLYQYRAMIINISGIENVNSEWFAPFMFFTCAGIQAVYYIYSEKKMPKKKEIIAGIGGGFTNLLCTMFLLLSANRAAGLENALIFPIASIACITLTNFWSQMIYSETINWRACQLLLLGIVIGTINWGVILEKIKPFLP